MTGKRYTSKQQERAVQLFERGWTIARITRQNDMPSQGKTVRRWLREHGQELRGNPPRYNRERILAELHAGDSRSEICHRYGCSMKYLSRLLAQEDGPVNGHATKPSSIKKKPAKKRTKKKPPKKVAKKKAPKKKRAKKRTKKSGKKKARKKS